jgi:peptidoglycan L-alanyl-D-glutamate endopeptidase CwlK
MSYSYGERSKGRLDQCDAKIQLIMNEVIKIADVTVITGHRTEEEQDDKFNKGYSKVKWPDSKHNTNPSRAIDIAPYIKPYGVITGHPDQIVKIAEMRSVSREAANSFVLKAYARLIGQVEAVAEMAGIGIRVGLDWDGDYDTLDQSFNDLMHVELK